MQRMIYDKRLGDSLVVSGLLIAIFLGFEVFSETTFNVGQGITLDSTYIVAFMDAGMIYFGLVLRSRKRMRAQEVVGRIDALKTGTLVLAFVLCGYLILCTVPNVPWHDVYWFDPPLNFQLIRDYFENNLYVSIILVLVLFIVLFIRRPESAEDRGSDKSL